MNLLHTVYEPSGDGPHPTLLTLHGWGANALDLLGLAPHLCGGAFLVICPQGPIRVPLGGATVGYGWFPITGAGPVNVPAVLEARGQVQAFLADALQRYPSIKKSWLCSASVKAGSWPTAWAWVSLNATPA